MTVLVFDSGIGGLSILREARVVMPEQRFIYVGDDAGFPYGDWEETALTAHIVDLFDHLLSRFKPDVAVVACNTASTLILPALRERFDVPFVGTVPAIKPAAEQTRSGMISVLGTPGTIQRPYTLDLIQQFAADVRVNLVGAQHLARLAEDYLQQREIDDALLAAEIAPCFVDDQSSKTDIVVLGCTHYPFLANPMRKLAPWPVDWIDPAEAIALHTRDVIKNCRKSSSTGSSQAPETPELQDIAMLTSGSKAPGVRRLLGGFGFPSVVSLQDESLAAPSV